MQAIKTYAAVILLFASVTGYAQEDMSPLWKEVGRWEIRVDTTLGSGCFAIVIDDERVFRFGINNTTSRFYGIIGKIGWESIEQEGSYSFDLEFDSEGAWEIPATGIDFGGIKGLSFEVGDALFVDEMVERRMMYVRYRGDQIMKLSMQGSARAVRVLRDCIETFETEPDNSAEPSDPFSSSDDPFEPSY